jgi:hypothetical protein
LIKGGFFQVKNENLPDVARKVFYLIERWIASKVIA